MTRTEAAKIVKELHNNPENKLMSYDLFEHFVDYFDLNADPNDSEPIENFSTSCGITFVSTGD